MTLDPLVYQLGFGVIIFGAGLGVGIAQGDLPWKGRGLVRWAALLGGFLVLFGGQAYLQYAPMSEAPAVAYAGAPLEVRPLGTPLDYGILIGWFAAILVAGTVFGKHQPNTKDFFFAGQRFSWWLVSVSLVATTIGSYSFVKYSKIAWEHGLASTQTYLNDWLWLPLLLFAWLPILYFGRLQSIPEYFERRFDRGSRRAMTALLLFYLIGYVGVNLFTMGKALNILLGWPVFGASVLVAAISTIYVAFGGQTSVIMTDLLQGAMLLATGLVLLVLGIVEIGGFEAFWEHLPRGHRQAFPSFNGSADYPAVGIFWQDAVANSAMFYFLNQGILMRFMAARSIQDARRAAVVTFALLMPLAAVVVASGGWVGAAFAHAGLLPADMDGGRVFFIVAEQLARPGLFGLVMAALTAALMSTVDSLLTAVAAIAVNDVVRPLRPDLPDKTLLLIARMTSVAVAVLGIALVPVFMQFDSIYAAHGAFTAAVTPPMVVALLGGLLWRRMTAPAATATLLGGAVAVSLSIIWPDIITPIAHGVPIGEAGEGLLGGVKQHQFMRALFGLLVSGVIAVGVTLVTKPVAPEKLEGTVWNTVGTLISRYVGKAGRDQYGAVVTLAVTPAAGDALTGPHDLPLMCLTAAARQALGASEGDLLYVSDPRGWLGGLRSVHGVVGPDLEGDGLRIEVGESPSGVLQVAPGGAVTAQVFYAV